MNYDLGYIATQRDIIAKKMLDDRLENKIHEDFDEKDKAIISKNVRTKNYLICDLDRSIHNSIEQASNAHDMWKMLKVT